MDILYAARAASLAAAFALVSANAVVVHADNDSISNEPGRTVIAQSDRGGTHDGNQPDDKKVKKVPQAKPSVPADQQGQQRGNDQARQNDRQPNPANARRGRVERMTSGKRNAPPVQNARREEAKPAGRTPYTPAVRNEDRGGDRSAGRREPDRNWNAPAPRQEARFQKYRHNYRSVHRYQVERYRWSGGNSYRRYGYGERLPRYYFSQNFWLTNFILYELFAPPPGLIWVRYGPDALLIDEETGEIIQVRYDVFYS
ncbi:MAG: RcnB family protein [Micropepsaceae bacterium]